MVRRVNEHYGGFVLFESLSRAVSDKERKPRRANPLYVAQDECKLFVTGLFKVPEKALERRDGMWQD